MLSFVSDTGALAELIDKDQDFRQIGAGYGFTEGPAWNPVGNYLVFSDIPGDRRWRWSEAKGMELDAWPTFKGNGMAYEADGSLLVCEQVSSTLVRFTPDGHRDLVAFHYQGKYLNSPNDVIVRSDGAIYFTDPNYGRWDVPVGLHRRFELDFQGLFLVPPGGGDCVLVSAEKEFEQPNGLAFSPDESILYVNDRNDLKAFDVAPDGSLSNVRTLQENMGSAGNGNGSPDGMEVDALGNIWCTARGGIWVIAPSGDVLGVIETPAVAGSLVWGGEDLRSLFVCTTTTMHVIKTKVGPAPIPFSGGGAQ
jgi:gluconolactonase